MPMTSRKRAPHQWSPATLIAGLVAGAVALGVLVSVAISPSDTPEQIQSFAFGEVVLTEAPSASPSGMPSSSPSLQPSSTPSASPSLEPSASPSDSPSSEPSSTPSALPSAWPTLEPTASPTYFPTETPSSFPTDVPLPDDYVFRLKLHWQREFFWQESYEEQDWCLECVFCDPIGNAPEGEDLGCTDLNGDSNDQCTFGDQLWIRSCGTDKGNAKFSLIQHASGGDQVRIAYTELCMEMVESKYIQILQCDENEPRQRWYGFRPYGETFELRPLEKQYRCLTQLHHPKRSEVVYAGNCETAQFDDTSLWRALDP